MKFFNENRAIKTMVRELKIPNSKKPTLSNRAFLNRSLAMSYSHMGTPTLPSALLHFTSEFGMGSGGSTALLSLDKNNVYGHTSVAVPWMAKSDVYQHT